MYYHWYLISDNLKVDVGHHWTHLQKFLPPPSPLPSGRQPVQPPYRHICLPASASTSGALLSTFCTWEQLSTSSLHQGLHCICPCRHSFFFYNMPSFIDLRTLHQGFHLLHFLHFTGNHIKSPPGKVHCQAGERGPPNPPLQRPCHPNTSGVSFSPYDTNIGDPGAANSTTPFYTSRPPGSSCSGVHVIALGVRPCLLRMYSTPSWKVRIYCSIY